MGWGWDYERSSFMSHCKKRGMSNLNIRLILKLGDIIKLILGWEVLILDSNHNSIYMVQKGDDTYICKG